MTYARLSETTNQWMKSVHSWISEEELEQIKKVKGDVSISLWVRRQIRKALSSEGGLPATSPETANVVPNVHADVVKTTTTTPGKEVEVV
jgi:hypothetical protein